MKKALSVLLIFVFCVSILAGCSGDTALTGKYICVEITGEDEDETLEALKELFESVGLDWVDPYLEFLDEDKFKMTLFSEDDIAEGTYVVDGKNIELTVDGDVQKGTIDGKKITLTEDGMVMVFEKQ